MIRDRDNPEHARWDASGYPAFASGKGRRFYYDTEGNALLEDITAFWCIGGIDLDSREEFYWGVDQPEGSGRTLADGLKFLEECALAIAHNGYDFDRRALKKIYPAYRGPEAEWDSLVLVKTIWPAETLLGPDLDRVRKGTFPARLLKRHSLEAWGHRTGTHKGEYKGVPGSNPDDRFASWNPWMAEYMMGDNAAGVAIWDLCMRKLGWVSDPKNPNPYVWPKLPIEIEHDTHQLMIEQREDGVRFDVAKATRMAAELQNMKAALEQRLVDIFGSWWQPLSDIVKGEVPARSMQRAMVGFPDITIRRVSEKTGKELKPYVGPPMEEFTEGCPFVRIERTKFNPTSRQHLGMRLQFVYGWKPKAFGKNGEPTVDETVLSEIPESVMPAEVRKDILNYFVVNKTLGMLTQGRQGWLKLVTDQGRIHGKVDPLGTVTTRAAHSGPNLGQCPAVKKAKVVQPDGTKKEVPIRGLEGKFGYECRDLFCADEGWEQTGIDEASLELILLGHWLWAHDDGAFSARVCDPTRDAHQENAEVTGTTRADAKTVIYLKVYGGSAYKLSLDPAIIVLPEQVPELLTYRGLPMLLKSLKTRFGDDYVEPDDMGKARLVRSRKIIMAFDEGIVGLKDLMEGVTKAAERGWLKGIDGRKIHVRKAHAALNALLQSAGAIVCKLWMIYMRRAMTKEGWVRGVDYKQVLWVHDEVQFTHRPGLGPRIREIAEDCAVRVGVDLKVRGRFRTSGSTGSSWASCH